MLAVLFSMELSCIVGHHHQYWCIYVPSFDKAHSPLPDSRQDLLNLFQRIMMLHLAMIWINLTYWFFCQLNSLGYIHFVFCFSMYGMKVYTEELGCLRIMTKSTSKCFFIVYLWLNCFIVFQIQELVSSSSLHLKKA